MINGTSSGKKKTCGEDTTPTHAGKVFVAANSGRYYRSDHTLGK
jgi:hypothetical protein